jgi:TetR/AcrR family transcriptional regulator, cholesterol catabolism regulator
LDPRPTYDEKLRRILRESAAIFAEKGYHRASIRDIAAATDVSLSGLYYYFGSKEELLFLIQDQCFGTLLDRLAAELAGIEDPIRRLRVLVRTHLAYFLANRNEMKVLSHEAGVLTGELREVVRAKKRRYAAEAAAILADLRPPDGVDVRNATFALFGMINWIYTWHRPGKDSEADQLAEDMIHVFLRGFLASGPDGGPEGGAPANRAEASSALWRTASTTTEP